VSVDHVGVLEGNCGTRITTNGMGKTRLLVSTTLFLDSIHVASHAGAARRTKWVRHYIFTKYIFIQKGKEYRKLNG